MALPAVYVCHSSSPHCLWPVSLGVYLAHKAKASSSTNPGLLNFVANFIKFPILPPYNIKSDLYMGKYMLIGLLFPIKTKYFNLKVLAGFFGFLSFVLFCF